MKTIVHHWRHEDGWKDIPYILRDSYGKDKEFDKFVVGWHCWVYPENDHEFEVWMKLNMKGYYDLTHRFNSGNPMYTVFIKEDADATMFKLRWM